MRRVQRFQTFSYGKQDKKSVEVIQTSFHAALLCYSTKKIQLLFSADATRIIYELKWRAANDFYVREMRLQ